MEGPLVSVLVAAYNEEDYIEEVLREVAGLPFRLEIVVVDDGSADRTAAIVTRLGDEIPALTLIRHERNRGKGAAIRTAIDASTGDVVIVQDADKEYAPRDIPKLIGPILEGEADVVYGTRLRGGEPQRAHLFWHHVGNRFLSLLTNILFNTTISDMEVGYKAFCGDLVRDLDLISNDFRFEPEVTAKVLRIPAIRLYEIPISYYGRSYAEGKKIGWRDGVYALVALVRFRFGS